MSASTYGVITLDAMSAAVLLNAAMAKFAAPGQLRATLRATADRRWTNSDVRLIALGEVVTALLLVIPVTRPAGAVCCGLLGLAFAAFGVVGWRIRSTIPCGCFGPFSKRPLGPVNIAMGTALMAISVVTLLWHIQSAGNAGEWITGATVTSLTSLLLILPSARALISPAHE